MISIDTKRIYLGDWENDIKHGNGIERFSSSALYTGEYMNGKAEGTGIY